MFSHYNSSADTTSFNNNIGNEDEDDNDEKLKKMKKKKKKGSDSVFGVKKPTPFNPKYVKESNMILGEMHYLRKLAEKNNDENISYTKKFKDLIKRHPIYIRDLLQLEKNNAVIYALSPSTNYGEITIIDKDNTPIIDEWSDVHEFAHIDGKKIYSITQPIITKVLHLINDEKERIESSTREKIKMRKQKSKKNKKNKINELQKTVQDSLTSFFDIIKTKAYADDE